MDIKDELTTRDVIKIVCEGLGSGEPIDNRNGALQFQTVCHNKPGEGSYKLYYYISTKMFHCYTECSDSFDIIELVCRSKKINIGEAVEFIKQVTGKFPGREGFDFEDGYHNNLWEKYENSEVEEIRENKPIPSYYLKFFDTEVPYVWKKEGISIYAMKQFGVRIDYATNKIIVPHYDKDNNLIGIRGRSLDPWDIYRGNKYMPVKVGSNYLAHQLGLNLYGINLNKEYIKKYKTVILFEGEKSVMKYEDISIENISLAVCGSNISNEQVKLLEELGVEEVIIAFDKMFKNPQSEEAKEYRAKLVKLGLRLPNSMSVYYIWDNKDLTEYKSAPIDYGVNTFKMLMKMKKLIKDKVVDSEQREG